MVMASLSVDPLAGLFVDVRMQHADEGQVAVSFREVQAVADHKVVRHGEPDVIGRDFFNAPRGFVEQDADFDAARFEGANFGQHAIQGLAGVQDVVQEQHIAATHVQPQFLGENQVTRFQAVAVTGNAQKIQSQRQVQMPQQIRQKHHRAVEQRDDDGFAPVKVALDFARQAADASRELRFRDEHALNFLAPAWRNRFGRGLGHPG